MTESFKSLLLGSLISCALASFCDVFAQPTSETQATASLMLGRWYILATSVGKPTAMKGSLVIDAATGPNEFSGVLHMQEQKSVINWGVQVVENARISVEGNSVTIKCSIQSATGLEKGRQYYADQYFLTLSTGVGSHTAALMKGRGMDAGGNEDNDVWLRKYKPGFDPADQ